MALLGYWAGRTYPRRARYFLLLGMAAAIAAAVGSVFFAGFDLIRFGYPLVFFGAWGVAAEMGSRTSSRMPPTTPKDQDTLEG
jgi:hypothetical protein